MGSGEVLLADLRGIRDRGLNSVQSLADLGREAKAFISAEAEVVRSELNRSVEETLRELDEGARAIHRELDNSFVSPVERAIRSTSEELQQFEQAFQGVLTTMDQLSSAGSAVQQNLVAFLSGFLKGVGQRAEISDQAARELAKVYVSIFPSPYTLTNFGPYADGFVTGFRKTAETLGAQAAKIYIEVDKKGMSAATKDWIDTTSNRMALAAKQLADASRKESFFGAGLVTGEKTGVEITSVLDKGKDEIVRTAGKILGGELILYIFELGIGKLFRLGRAALKKIPGEVKPKQRKADPRSDEADLWPEELAARESPAEFAPIVIKSDQADFPTVMLDADSGRLVIPDNVQIMLKEFLDGFDRLMFRSEIPANVLDRRRQSTNLLTITAAKTDQLPTRYLTQTSEGHYELTLDSAKAVTRTFVQWEGELSRLAIELREIRQSLDASNSVKRLRSDIPVTDVLKIIDEVEASGALGGIDISDSLAVQKALEAADVIPDAFAVRVITDSVLKERAQTVKQDMKSIGDRLYASFSGSLNTEFKNVEKLVGKNRLDLTPVQRLERDKFEDLMTLLSSVNDAHNRALVKHQADIIASGDALQIAQLKARKQSKRWKAINGKPLLKFSGHPPTVKMLVETKSGFKYRTLNKEHVKRRTDDPAAAIDIENLVAAGHIENSPHLEHIRKNLPRVLDNDLEEWIVTNEL